MTALSISHLALFGGFILTSLFIMGFGLGFHLSPTRENETETVSKCDVDARSHRLFLALETVFLLGTVTCLIVM